MSFFQVSPPIYADYPEPHLDRTRRILAAHPEVRQLFGTNPWTSLFVLGIVALQLGMAVWLKDSSVWALLLASYTVGALANHALFTLIHDCTHNLVFKSATLNAWLQIVANFPIVLPSAMSFRTYHLKHHAFQGDTERDADLARPLEAKVVGHSTLGKAIWLLLFPIWQVGRVPYLKGIPMFSKWVAVNWIVCLAVTGSLTYFFGWNTLLYLTFSTFFSIGLHPVGARWIQEHYTVKPDQETYSYYGPLNLTAFNVGYHNEHHDFMSVPWSRLPRVRALAPEFYDTLHWHRSWTALLLKFLFDPKMSLNSRVHRGKEVQKFLKEHPGLRSVPPTAPEGRVAEPVTV